MSVEKILSIWDRRVKSSSIVWVDRETSAFLEKALGIVEIEESKKSVPMGVNSERDGIILARHTAHKAHVIASKIQTLPDLEVFLRPPGQFTV